MYSTTRMISKLTGAVVAILVFQTLLCPTEGYKHSQETQAGPQGYIEYLPGTLNVILSVPHGGSKDPSPGQQDRVAGCWDGQKCIYTLQCQDKDQKRCHATVEPDANTIKLARAVRAELWKITGKYPHVIINHLVRSKLDPNRAMPEATFNQPISMQAWNKYHGFINQSKSEMDSPGLLLDIHGQSHTIQRTELGYGITRDDLNSNKLNPETTSIRSLAKRHSEIPFEEIVRGKQSFGGLLESAGFSAVPSPKYPGPENEPYFNGGYTSATHGSRHGGNVDAFQVESAKSFRQKEMLQNYAKSLAKVIHQYLKLYYAIPMIGGQMSGMGENRMGSSGQMNGGAVIAMVIGASFFTVLLLLYVGHKLVLKGKRRSQQTGYSVLTNSV